MGIEPVLDLIEAALDSSLSKIALACIVGSNESEYDLERIRGLIEDRLDTPVEEIDRLFLIEDVAAPLGSGAQLDVSSLPARNSLDQGCNEVMSTVSIHPDGSVKAGCGHAQFYQPDLTLGNLREEPLQEIIDRGRTNLIYWLIHEVGPKRLIERLDVDDDTDYSNICHACHGLFEYHREKFLNYVKENREELIRDEIFLSRKIKKRGEILNENKGDMLTKLETVEAAKCGCRTTYLKTESETSVIKQYI